jgi:H+/Cl- antiporter ClcA
MVNVWIPIVVAIVIGFLAVLFLYYYRAVYTFFNKVLRKVPHYVRIFIVFALSIIAGIVSLNYVSTGHHLIEEILTNGTFTVGTLLLILLVRSTLTLSANTNSINGGMFIPIMALGAVASSTIAKIMINLGVNESYYTVIVVIGITACISSMMKTPLTAIVFAIEALACDDNILFVIITSIIAYMITEIFRAKSINDTIIERRTEEINGESKPEIVELAVTIKDDAFAIGKQIRDIFWPRGLKVLSVHREQDENETDEYAESTLNKGDILHVRYSTTDNIATLEELYAIVGNQNE